MQLPNFFAKAIYAFSAIILTSSAAVAGVVTLSANDNSMSISGELLSFDGSAYVLDGTFGDVTIDASLVTCSGESCPVTLDEGRFTIVGSNAIGAGLLPSLIEFYALMNDMDSIEMLDDNIEESLFILESTVGGPNVDITVMSSNGSTAIEALLNRTAALGMLSTTPSFYGTSDAYANFVEAVEPGDNNIIGLDGLAIVVQQGNQVDSLSIDQIAGIFSGAIANWADVGGNNTPISVYALEDTLSSAQFFSSAVLAPLGGTVSPGARLYSDNRQLANAVSDDPNAIGFVSIAFAGSTKTLSLRDQCGGLFTPSPFSLKSEDYPLMQQLHIIPMAASMTDMAKNFLGFVDTDVAQTAVIQGGFANLDIVELPFSQQGDRLISLVLANNDNAERAVVTELVEDFHYARRLSSTFRFDFTATSLDNNNANKIARLARYIRDVGTPNMEIIVAGFSSTAGSSAQNASLAENAAQLIEAQLSAALGSTGVSVVSKGYGDISPLSCDVDTRNAHINQRVEIWVK